jgi:hypothetical protein
MILKLENQYKMISEITYDRQWTLKYSLINRKCYFSGQSLRFQPCYVGRKKIRSLLSKRYQNDDIWISKEHYLNMIKNGMV